MDPRQYSFLISKKTRKKGKSNKGQVRPIKTNSKMVDLNLIISVMTLNVNVLNTLF